MDVHGASLVRAASNPPLQRTNGSVASLPLARAAERHDVMLQAHLPASPGPCDPVYAGNIQLVTGFPGELARCTGFEGDAGNADKNWELHDVSRREAEEAFFNRPLVVAPGRGAFPA